jgi:hypothetical protein
MITESGIVLSYIRNICNLNTKYKETTNFPHLGHIQVIFQKDPMVLKPSFYVYLYHVWVCSKEPYTCQGDQKP